MARWEDREKLICRKCGLLFEDETGYGGDICNPCLEGEIALRRDREKRKVARMLERVTAILTTEEGVVKNAMRIRHTYSIPNTRFKSIGVHVTLIRSLRFAKKCLEDNPDLWLYALDGRCLI